LNHLFRGHAWHESQGEQPPAASFRLSANQITIAQRDGPNPHQWPCYQRKAGS